MEGTVLVTRPEPGASATARRLSSLGFRPLAVPLTRTVPVAPATLPDGHDFDAVAVTSAAALRHAPPELIARLAALPCFAVGHASARTARDAGFTRVEPGEGRVEGLAGAMSRSLRPGARIAYLCGRVRTGGLACRLAEAGLEARVIEVYDTVAAAHPPGGLEKTLDGRPIDAALIYSAYAAAILSRLAAGASLKSSFAGTRFLCISDRAAAALGPQQRQRAAVAEDTTEDALLALLGARH